MKYARLIDSKVVEVIETPVGFSIEQCIVPELAAQCVPCPDEVQQFWEFDGKKFVAPEIVIEPIIIDAEVIE
jgi:hypothetical protein